MISRRQFLLRSAATGAGLATAPGLLATPKLSGSKVSAITNPCASSSYMRLFPARKPSEAGSVLERALSDLALKMKEDDSESGAGDILAGYTYLGQFIDHDLTLDITPLDQARKNPLQITNFRTPFLDLDQLYGGGPTISPHLYRKHGSDSSEGGERFLLGATAASTVVDGVGHSRTLSPSCNDLPRNSQGIALVGDARQDENLILAQLQVAFLKLHNLVLDRPELLRASPHYDIEPRFEAARRVVTWHYQWLVRNDFLKAIVDPDVFKHLESPDYKPLIKASAEGFRIPVEFSAAAFRFGHSMVRNEYFYNDFHSDPRAELLADLLERTGFGKSGRVPIPEEWVIDWKRFFAFPSPDASAAQPAQKIDTKIAAGLFQLPSAQMRAFNLVSSSKLTFAADPPALPTRTLLRGARLGLPSGEQVEAEVRRRMPGVRTATEDEIVSGAGQAILTDPKNRLRRNTPLWYYVLKEAEVLRQGASLGPVGSRIVADVILGALEADPESYISVAGPHWKPTLWTPDLEKETLEEMSKLLELVAPDQPTKACNST